MIDVHCAFMLLIMSTHGVHTLPPLFEQTSSFEKTSPFERTKPFGQTPTFEKIPPLTPPSPPPPPPPFELTPPLPPSSEWTPPPPLTPPSEWTPPSPPPSEWTPPPPPPSEWTRPYEQTTPFSNETRQFAIDVQNAVCFSDMCLRPDTKVNSSQYMALHTPNVGHILIKAPDRPNTQCCKRTCSCDIRTCLKMDSCCLDVLDTILSVKEQQTVLKPKCAYPQLRSFHKNNMANADFAVLMFRGCPDVVERSLDMLINIDKCEVSDTNLSWDTMIPVTDRKTLFTYKNRFCALCNDVDESDLVNWKVSIDCRNTEIVNLNTFDTVIKDVMNTNTCNIIYQRNTNEFNNTDVSKCTVVIDRCNVTGKWREYNHFIEAVCLSYTYVYNNTYKNIFCYMCNSDDNIFPSMDCRGDTGGYVWPSFTALLQFNPSNQEKTDDQVKMASELTKNVCNNNQLYDYFKEVCRPLSCRSPRYLMNGMCVNLLKTEGGVTFTMYLKLKPEQPLEVNTIHDVFVMHTILSHIYDLFRELGIIGITPTLNLYRNIESDYIKYFVVHADVQPLTNDALNVSVIEKLVDIDRTFIELESLFVQNNFLVELVTLKEIKLRDDTQLIDPVDSRKLEYMEYSIPEINLPSFQFNMAQLILTRWYICPLVTLDSSEYEFSFFNWGLSVMELDLNLTLDDYNKIVDKSGTTIQMCGDLFPRLPNMTNDQNTNENSISESSNPQSYLSLVCTCISLACSIMTLLTYILFKQLRTQAGINNIFLTLSLICAQSMFQFGSGQQNDVSDVTCSIIGALVHFLWLHTIMWMNVCTFHMFRVFCGQTIATHESNVLCETTRYVIYSLVVAAIPVGVNICVVVIDSDGDAIGYGGKYSCYISLPFMIGYTFALPVGLVLLSNAVMFVLVVIQIQRSSISGKKRSCKKRQFIKIYAKLSTITGIAWVCGFISVFTGIVEFEYLFIIFNGMQGFFIFTAFVYNKRVLRFYSSIKFLKFSDSESRKNSNNVVQPTQNGKDTHL